MCGWYIIHDTKVLARLRTASSHLPALPKSRHVKRLTSVRQTVGQIRSTNWSAYGAAAHKPVFSTLPWLPRRFEWTVAATPFRRRFLGSGWQHAAHATPPASMSSVTANGAPATTTILS